MPEINDKEAAFDELVAVLGEAEAAIGQIADFLVGYGDAADLAAKRLRDLRSKIWGAIDRTTGTDDRSPIHVTDGRQ